MRTSQNNLKRETRSKKPLKRFRNATAKAHTSPKRGVNETATRSSPARDVNGTKSDGGGASGSQGEVLRRLGLKETNSGVFSGEWTGSGKLLESVSPINGEVIA